MHTTHNARVQLFAAASCNLGVAAIAAGVVAPMVSGKIRFLPSLVAWTVIGIDFISLAWKATGMSLETYWIVVAPLALLGLSGVGWLTLWLTRDRDKHRRPRTP